GLTRQDRWLYVHVSTREDDPKAERKPDLGLFAIDPRSGAKVCLVPGIADFAGFTSSEDGTCLAFTSNKEDWNSKKPLSDLYLWDGTDSPAVRVAHRASPGIPAGKVIAAGGLAFSRDGRVLAFGVQDPPEGDPPLLLPEEKVNLDLWHWQDGLLQTQQAKQVGSRRNPAWTCVYHRDDGRIVQLGDAQIPRARLLTADGSLALLLDDTPYEKLITWDARYCDVWIANTVDGTRKRVLEKLRGSPDPSPLGKWLLWFGTDYAWHALDVNT